MASIAQRELGNSSLVNQLSTADAGGLREGSVIRVPNAPAQTAAPVAPSPVTPVAAPIAPTAPTTPAPKPLTAPSAEEFAKLNTGQSATATAPATAPTNTAPAQPVAPVTPVITNPVSGPTPTTVPNNTIIAPAGTGVKYPERVGMTGSPQYKGGDQTRDIFNELKAGTRQANIYSQDVAEQEANQIFQSYGRYQTQNTSGLLEAISKGELTPDPNNLLWTSLYQDGKPTPAQVEAFGKWDLWVKKGGGQRESNPFLGGQFNQITSLEQANIDLNKAQEAAMNGAPITPAPTASSGTTGADSLTLTTSQKKLYEDMLTEQFQKFSTAANEKAPVSEYEKKLQGFIEKYGVNSLEDQLTQLDTQINREQDFLMKQRNAVMNDPNQSLSSAAGNLSQNERNLNERIASLNTQKQTMVDQLQSRYKITEMLGNAYGLDYSAAKKNFEDDFARQQQFITSLSGQVQDERTYEKQVKDDAQANLNVLYKALTDGGLDASALTPDQKLMMNKLEAQAGLPQGMYEALMMKNPKANVIGQPYQRIDDEGNRWYDQVTLDKETGQPKVFSVLAGKDVTANLKNDLTQANIDLKGGQLDKITKELEMLPEKERLEAAKVLGYYTDPATGKMTPTAQTSNILSQISTRSAQLGINRDRADIYKSRIDALNNKADAPVNELADLNKLTQAYGVVALYGTPEQEKALSEQIDNALSSLEGGKKKSNVSIGSTASSSYEPTITSTGSVQINAPVTSKNGRQQLESLRRQCGAYVNDVLGTKLVGDSLASKERLVTPDQQPTPGGVFVLSNNAYGHIGMVEDTDGKNPPQKILISESNYDGKESFRRIWTTVESLKKRKLAGFSGALINPKNTTAAKQTTTTPAPSTDSQAIQDFVSLFK